MKEVNKKGLTLLVEVVQLESPREKDSNQALEETFIYHRIYSAEVEDAKAKIQEIKLLGSEMGGWFMERHFGKRMIKLPWDLVKEEEKHECFVKVLEGNS